MSIINPMQIVNSAKRLSEVQETLNKHSEHCAEKDRAIFKTAENTEKQKTS